MTRRTTRGFRLRLALLAGLALCACEGGTPDWSAPEGAELVDLRELLSSDSPEDLRARRAELSELLWGSRGFPRDAMPARTKFGVRSKAFEGLENLARIDAHEIEMDRDLDSIVYDFLPERGDGRILLYHQGHGGGFDRGRDTIAAFLADGCRVLAFSPPLLARNSRPKARLRDGRSVQLTRHDQLFELELERGHALRFFIEPVVVSLNAVLAEGDARVAMVGLSGGGWTTVVAAAIDERIDASYPVAATLPVHLRTERDWGDLEQTHPDLLAIASFPELYLLGATGPGRRQLQVYNERDPLVFGGRRHELFEPAVAERAASLGGSFEVFLDSENRDHSIGAAALTRLREDFRTQATGN